MFFFSNSRALSDDPSHFCLQEGQKRSFSGSILLRLFSFFCACQTTFYIFVSRKDNWSFSVSILLPLNDVGIRVRGSYFRTARVGRQLFPSALGGRTPAMPCTRHRPLERWSTSMPTLTPAWRTCTPRYRFKNWLFPSDQDQDLWKNLSLTIYMGTRFHIWPPAIVIHLVFECTLTCQKCKFTQQAKSWRNYICFEGQFICKI